MALMDPLHLCIALGPLATYLLVLGVINLSRRPVLATGARDAAALATAVAGLVIAGPFELFLVEEAAVAYGGWIWGLMLAAYALGVVLIILLLRPRLVIYNSTLDQLRPVLAEVVAHLDSEARWAGDSLVMPQLGVQLHIEAWPILSNVQLVSSGSNQSLHGWRQLEMELASALRSARRAPSPYGISILAFIGFLLLGVLIVAGISYNLAKNPAAATQALNEMLRR